MGKVTLGTTCWLRLRFATSATYAAFLCCLTFAHLARWAAAIFLRADADIVRFAGAGGLVFTSASGCDFSRTFAHLAFCARAILRREAADIILVGWLFWVVAEPFNDSITEIARSSFSTRDCISLRSALSC